MVSTVRPKASETPRRPMPTSGNAAASTALPQPANVSQNVPMASAAHLRISIEPLPGLIRQEDRLPVALHIYHGPAACGRLVEGRVEAAHMRLAVISPFAPPSRRFIVRVLTVGF